MDLLFLGLIAFLVGGTFALIVGCEHLLPPSETQK